MEGISGLKLLSILAFLLLLAGYGARRKKAAHIALMLTAFVIDMGIVVYIEVTRDALASAKAKMGPLMIVHIALSVAVLVFYAGQIVSGVRKARGRASRWHATGGPLLLLTRFGNLVTSFMVS